MLNAQRTALARWTADRFTVRPRAFVGGALAVVLLGAAMTPTASATATRTLAVEANAPGTNLAPNTGAVVPAYAYYYLWWSTQHWHDKLGASFPYNASPLPLPATLGASGCPPKSLYPGNQLTDVPPALFTQDDAAVIERDVRQAASSGLSGFVVNWNGTGLAGQTTQDSIYSRRLALLVAAVRRVQAERISFHLWVSLKASATIMTTAAIKNDLAYLARTYLTEQAFDRSRARRILLVWNGSRKYSLDTVRSVSSQFRGSFFILGDETAASWPDGRAASLDGDAYYWSSQDPWGNPASFTQLKTLAALVRGSGTNPDGSTKTWLAPFTPGYDSILTGGSTCPRKDGDTMRARFQRQLGDEPERLDPDQLERDRRGKLRHTAPALWHSLPHGAEGGADRSGLTAASSSCLTDRTAARRHAPVAKLRTEGHGTEGQRSRGHHDQDQADRPEVRAVDAGDACAPREQRDPRHRRPAGRPDDRCSIRRRPRQRSTTRSPTPARHRFEVRNDHRARRRPGPTCRPPKGPTGRTRARRPTRSRHLPPSRPQPIAVVGTAYAITSLRAAHQAALASLSLPAKLVSCEPRLQL